LEMEGSRVSSNLSLPTSGAPASTSLKMRLMLLCAAAAAR
jgi:hypothetical protein